MDDFIDLFESASLVAPAIKKSVFGYAPLELFIRWKDDLTPVYLHLLLENSWNVSPDETLQIIIHCRNCRSEEGGRGLRDQFYEAVEWLCWNHNTALIEMIPQIPNFGYWKDLWNIWDRVDELCRSIILLLVCNQIKKDMKIALNNYHHKETISLVGKWVPSVKRSLDKKFGLVGIICEQLGWSKREYKQNIGFLREKLNITERLVCQKRINEIDFSLVPAKSLSKHSNTFTRWYSNKYLEYRKNTRISGSIYSIYSSGNSSGNSGNSSSTYETDETLDTWDLIKWVIKRYLTKPIIYSEFLEVLWNEIVTEIKDISECSSVIPIIYSDEFNQTSLYECREHILLLTIAMITSSLNSGKLLYGTKLVEFDTCSTLYDRIRILTGLFETRITEPLNSALQSALNISTNVVVLSTKKWRDLVRKDTYNENLIKNILMLNKSHSNNITNKIDTDCELPSVLEVKTDRTYETPVTQITYWNLSHLSETQSLEFYPNPIAENVRLLTINGISNIAINDFLITGKISPTGVLKYLDLDFEKYIDV